MTGMYGGLIGLGRAIVRKSRLSNAMGIPLIFVVVVFLGGLMGFIITQKDLFFWIMFLPVLFFMFVFVFLMIFKSELLRTEEHEERMLQLSSGMGEKGKETTEDNILSLEQSPPEAVQIDKESRKEIE